jgi:diguanylate cyclase (GGDEF)-like protein
MSRDELNGWFQELRQVTEKSSNSLRELSDRACEIAAFFQQGNLLQSAITPEEGYEETIKLAKSLFPADAGALYLGSTAPADDTIEAVATWPASPPKRDSFARQDCWALRTGQVHVVDADRTWPICKHVPVSSCSSYLCVPMMAQGEALGVLHLRTGPLHRNQSKSEATRLPEVKQRLAIAMARRIAPAIANLRLRQLLTAQASRDPLTGLYNRRLLHETLGREVRRANRGKKRRGDKPGFKVKPVGVIMFDVDHFKRFNTRFTHLGGDALLRHLGTFLQESFCRRAGDLAFRYAGEEFTVILPGASLADCCRRATDLLKHVRRLHVRHEDKPLGRVTVSVGVAAFPEDGFTAEALIEVADKRLIRAKEKGRDRVEPTRPPNRQASTK